MQKEKQTNAFQIIFFFALVIMLGVVVFDRFYTPKVTVSYGKSAMYSKQDIDTAVRTVKTEFKNMEGCKLYSLSYAGDKRSKEELKYINEFGKYNNGLGCNSEFRTPLIEKYGWPANTVYTWTWYLGRTENGNWEVVQRGYD